MHPHRRRFLRTWCLAEGYAKCVRDAWGSVFFQPHVFNLHKKLKATRIALVRWNRLSFGNIFDRKKAIEEDVLNLEESLVGKWNASDFTRWSDLKHDWRDICSQEELFWKQKSHMNWLHEGMLILSFSMLWQNLELRWRVLTLLLMTRGYFIGL